MQVEEEDVEPVVVAVAVVLLVVVGAGSQSRVMRSIKVGGRGESRQQPCSVDIAMQLLIVSVVRNS